MKIKKPNLIKFCLFLLGFLFFLTPGKIFAQDSAFYGKTCDMNAADPCDTTHTGLLCVSGSCIVNNSSQPSPAPSPANVGGSSNCGDDPNLVWDSEAHICLPANKTQICTTGVCSKAKLQDLIVYIINIILGLAGVISVAVLVLGGFWYITSAGNEETAEKGKSAIINAIIGIVIVVMSYAIVAVISATISK